MDAVFLKRDSVVDFCNSLGIRCGCPQEIRNAVEFSAEKWACGIYVDSKVKNAV